MMVDVSIASGDKEAVVTEVVETPEKNKYKVTCKVQHKQKMRICMTLGVAVARVHPPLVV